MDVDWIKSELRKSGRTQTGLAKAMGVDPSAVTRILKGDRKIRLDEVPKIEAFLRGEPPTPLNEAVKAPGEFPEATEQGGSLPILASAQNGLAGGIVLSRTTIERRAMPEPLKGVEGGFGFYMIGNSMDPRFKHGELILVHPAKPAAPGDYVVVTLNPDEAGQSRTLVKELVAQTSGGLNLRQLNPCDSIHIAAEDVLSVQLIVGSYTSRA